MVTLAGVTLGVLIAGSARAQDYVGTMQGQAAGSPIPLPTGHQQHYVGPHFDAKGTYVPPHWEDPKKLPFRGYFAEDAKRRADQARGYTEPAPDYSTPIPDYQKPMEGREP